MTAIQLVNESENQNKKGAPAKRFEGQCLQVKVRTIGSKLAFEMPVANVSASGMLLGWKDSRRSPFAVNTILEMEIQHTALPASPAVGCLGKVVRRFSTAAGQPSFGVKIIQTESDEQVVWERIISSLGESMLSPE